MFLEVLPKKKLVFYIIVNNNYVKFTKSIIFANFIREEVVDAYTFFT